MPKGRSKELVINTILAYAWQSLICNTLLISLASLSNKKENILRMKVNLIFFALFLASIFNVEYHLLPSSYLCY